MRQLPNILTTGRIFLTIGFIQCLLQPGDQSILLAMLFFLLAMVSDFYDGYYAKKHQFITNFGKIMDPIADKFLILSAFFVFVPMGFVPLWIFYVIFVRETFVTGTRLAVIRKGEFIAAERAGKFKTALQMTVIFLMLGVLFIQQSGIRFSGKGLLERLGVHAVEMLLIATVWITLFSGLAYLWNNRHILLSDLPR